MSARVWDDDQLRQVHAWRLEGRTWDWIGARGGEPGDTAKRRYSKVRASGLLDRVLNGIGALETEPVAGSGERMGWKEENGKAILVASSSRRRTLPEFLEHAQVDLSRWHVKTHEIKSWDMGAKGPDGQILTADLWSIRASLELIPGIELAQAVKADLLADMACHAPRYKPVAWPVSTGERHLFEVCPMDLHVGMLAWGEETGSDFDSDLAHEIVGRAVGALLGRARGFPVDRIVIPLGNDFAHSDQTIDGAGGATRRGTPLDVDTRRAKMMRLVRVISVEMVDALRTVAPVEAVIVPGNHDEDTAVALGEILHAWYRHDEAVTVRHEPTPRKYVEYGQTLLGFTHGNREKRGDLPLLMATEAGEAWARTSHHEWHTGHLHRKGEAVEEITGVRVRTMPSLAAEDAWHAGKGYRHMRAMEAYLWEHDRGYVGHFSVGVPPELRDATLARRAA